MHGNKTLIALSAALAVLGLSSAALANDSGENNQGGAVIPGSMAGVNPVYHPGWFGRAASARSAYGFATTEHKRRLDADHRGR